MKKPIVVIGFLGTQLDAGQGTGRWEKWRPTVSLAQHDDMVVQMRLDCGRRPVWGRRGL